MTWTYGGTPGTGTAEERRDSVRLLVGDTDTSDQQIQDEEIAFFLSQSSDDIYLAGSQAADAIAAKYARLVNTQLDEAATDFSDRIAHYRQLATDLKANSKRFGTTGLGVPIVTGVSKQAICAADEDTDRVQPAFRMGMWRNPNQRGSYDRRGDD